MIHLVNGFLKSFENNCYTSGAFIDLTKAFDTVDHNILLKKLFHYGVRGYNFLKVTYRIENNILLSKILVKLNTRR